MKERIDPWQGFRISHCEDTTWSLLTYFAEYGNSYSAWISLHFTATRFSDSIISTVYIKKKMLLSWELSLYKVYIAHLQ